jgi:hypothetical protein
MGPKAPVTPSLHTAFHQLSEHPSPIGQTEGFAHQIEVLLFDAASLVRSVITGNADETPSDAAELLWPPVVERPSLHDGPIDIREDHGNQSLIPYRALPFSTRGG